MTFLPLLLGLLLVAFLTGSDSLFYLAYAIGGLMLLSFLWMRRAPQNLNAVRRVPARAFFGEEVPAELVVTNQGRLPILWLQLHESIPLPLHSPNFERRVVSLAPGEATAIRYRLTCSRRGYYRLGPLQLRTGDFFGLVPDCEFNGEEESFIVYPKVVPLRRLGLPSRLPYGELPSKQRIFEDPTRYFGVRDYMPGDSLRLINWKSSSGARELQVRRYQPAIALNALILLNLNLDDYSPKARGDAGERGIVVAASVAAHLIEQRQPVGLGVLGLDAVSRQVGLEVLPPLRGRSHLVRLLETLARAELAPAPPFIPTLARATADLGWGSSVVIVAPGTNERLVDGLLGLRRRGFNILFVATDPQTPFVQLRGQLEQIGVAAFHITSEKEMDVWR